MTTFRTFRRLVPTLAVAATCLAVAAPAHSAEAQARIIQGTTVSAAEHQQRWPFIVSLSERRWNGSLRHFCGGTLVSPTTVVTAAHCLPDNPDPNDLVAVTGRRDLDAVGGEELAVASYKLHAQYGEEPSLRSDVAIITLAQRSNAPTIKVVGPGEDPAWGEGVGLLAAADRGPWIGGWGDTADGAGTGSRQLQQALVPTRSDAACQANYPWENAIVPSVMFCAGAGNSTDACQGDSGGPLTVRVGNEWRLAGVVSWGIGCGGEYYGVYTRLAEFRPWLQERGAGIGTLNVTAPGGSPDAPAPVTGGGPAQPAPAESGPVPMFPSRGQVFAPGNEAVLYWRGNFSLRSVIVSGPSGYRRDLAPVATATADGGRAALVINGMPAGHYVWRVTGVTAGGIAVTSPDSTFSVSRMHELTASAKYKRRKVAVTGTFVANAGPVKVNYLLQRNGRVVQKWTASYPQANAARRFRQNLPVRRGVKRGGYKLVTTLNRDGRTVARSVSQLRIGR